MKPIQLTRGQQAIVDDIDYDWLSQWKWRALRHKSGEYYAVRSVRAGGSRTIYMHRVIAGASGMEQVDHVNGDKLDNCRGNLRVCTNAENQRNRGKHRDNASGFKGVAQHPATGRWQACIQHAGVKVHLGYFSDRIHAARAYDLAAERLHGDFARLNNATGDCPDGIERLVSSRLDGSLRRRDKLSPDVVAQIRAHRGWLSQEHLGRVFGVSQAGISQIQSGKWYAETQR